MLAPEFKVLFETRETNSKRFDFPVEWWKKESTPSRFVLREGLTLKVFHFDAATKSITFVASHTFPKVPTKERNSFLKFSGVSVHPTLPLIAASFVCSCLEAPGQGDLVVWDYNEGKICHHIPDHDLNVSDVYFTPTGDLIADIEDGENSGYQSGDGCEVAHRLFKPSDFFTVGDVTKLPITSEEVTFGAYQVPEGELEQFNSSCSIPEVLIHYANRCSQPELVALKLRRQAPKFESMAWLPSMNRLFTVQASGDDIKAWKIQGSSLVLDKVVTIEKEHEYAHWRQVHPFYTSNALLLLDSMGSLTSVSLDEKLNTTVRGRHKASDKMEICISQSDLIMLSSYPSAIVLDSNLKTVMKDFVAASGFSSVWGGSVPVIRGGKNLYYMSLTGPLFEYCYTVCRWFPEGKTPRIKTYFPKEPFHHGLEIDTDQIILCNDTKMVGVFPKSWTNNNALSTHGKVLQTLLFPSRTEFGLLFNHKVVVFEVATGNEIRTVKLPSENIDLYYIFESNGASWAAMGCEGELQLKSLNK